MFLRKFGSWIVKRKTDSLGGGFIFRTPMLMYVINTVRVLEEVSKEHKWALKNSYTVCDLNLPKRDIRNFLEN